MSIFNRRLWLVAAALSAAIAFVGIVHPVSTSLKPEAATPAPKFAAGHQIVHSRATDAIIHNDLESRLFDDANLDDVCSRIATQAAYESQPGEASITASEPSSTEKKQLSRVCAKKMISSDDEILSRMRDAANAGSVDAKRHVLEQKLQQDTEDLDAIASDLSPEDMPAVRAYYADDVTALHNMALQPDAEAARLMAQLEEDGKLVERDPVEAASWQIFARISAQSVLPADADLLRDPALEDFGDEDSAAAISLAKMLYSHMPPANAGKRS
jgi:hypothetical protein